MNAGGTDHHFAALIDRILRCREAEDEAKEDTKRVYAELKGFGYDKTIAGALVAELRKREKNPAKFDETGTMLDLYRASYERGTGTVIAIAHTHEKSGSAAVGEMSLTGPGTGPRAPADESAQLIQESQPVTPFGSNPSLAAREGDKAAAPIPVSVAGIEYDTARTAPAEGAHTETSAPITNPQPVPSLATDQTGEEVPSASPVALSDDDVPAFLKDKQDCRKLANGSCKIKFHTSALCSECETARVNARAMA